jgi:hypothetical protein
MRESPPATMDDILVKILVVAGSCEVIVLLLTWYMGEPDD